MKWPVLAVVALGIAATGCDRLSSLPFIGGGGDETAAVDTAQAPMTGDATALAGSETLDTTAFAPEPEPAVLPRPRTASRVMVDEPWFPIDTGTVLPGMTRMEVIAVWGEPVTERSSANRTYLYYRNGCEVTCGTFDVVFLEGDQVMDAIVRGLGHTYGGISSSPPDRQAEFTPPGTEGGDAGVS
ncbi:MAG: hypothetical protein V3T74_09795 [Gemmatimonadales bacterium]|jgi:hypothetical protein